MVDIGYRGSNVTSQQAQSVPAVSWAMLRPQVTRKTGDLTIRQITLLFVAMAAMAAIPIILHPLPPVTDYINHLARMHVIASIGSDPDLAHFYEIDWQIIPNLMMDMVVPPLERIMSIFVAGQVYTITSFVLILSGTLALNRQLFGQWSILPLIAFPLLYNNVFLVGTMNYVFGIGLSLWALVVWVWLRERHPLLRLSVSTFFVQGLFFCHMYAVGIYGLVLLAFESSRLLAIYRRRSHAVQTHPPATSFRGFWPVLDFVATGLPFLPVVPLLMMSPTWGLRASYSWELAGKIEGLLYVVEVYSHFSAFLFTGILAFAAGWGLRDRAFKFHSFGWFLLALGAVTYMALPRVLFETFMADQRLPISLAFVAIACAHLHMHMQRARHGFVTVLVLLLAIRVFEVQYAWSGTAATAASFRDSVQQIERGSKVLVGYADPDAGDDVKDMGLVHAACLAIIERSALVTTAFTVVGKQIMHAREPFRDRVDIHDGTPPSINQLLQVASLSEPEGTSYWRRWTSEYDYLYVLFTDPDYRNPDAARLTPVFKGARFVLYRIKSLPAADEIAQVPEAESATGSVGRSRKSFKRLVDSSVPLPPE
jgi:hypothetical protein